tara:strand:- start:88096 stop:89094 length:999 start_codon:yes stop_codon:yes gene_type:complete
LEIIIRKSKPIESEVYKTYWKFAVKRQEIFFNRIENKDIWTNDEILKRHKFTNAYRASDRVSQYLIKNVIYGVESTPLDTLFRILLFKTFNKIETWQAFEREFGQVSYQNFNFEYYDNLLTRLMANNISIYSGAYIMTSGKSKFGHNKKHRNHLKLIDYMMHDNLFEKVVKSQSMDELFNILKSYPTIGNFLAYQYAIDINYSELTNFNEMDFVFPGPGALDGIRKCFTDIKDYSESDIIRYVAEKQDAEFQKFNLTFISLWGRKLHLIDCQNLFCEVDKYARVAHPEVSGITGRTRIKQKFTPQQLKIDFWYPPKWGINQKIKELPHGEKI